jgi:hypothetical protein
LSFHFDALEQTDQQSSISWESSSNFSPDNSCQNCSFNFWSQKLKNREKILARKSITIQRLVLKAIFKVSHLLKKFNYIFVNLDSSRLPRKYNVKVTLSNLKNASAC